LLYTTEGNKKPVKEFIKTLSPPTIAKISRTIDLLTEYGSFLSMPHSKKLTADICELRIHGRQEIRIFYTIKAKNIYLLHAFQKQSQKTPKKDLEIASERMKYLT